MWWQSHRAKPAGEKSVVSLSALAFWKDISATVVGLGRASILEGERCRDCQKIKPITPRTEDTSNPSDQLVAFRRSLLGVAWDDPQDLSASAARITSRPDQVGLHFGGVLIP